MLEVYQWIEFTRKAHLLSKQEMAERLHISPRTYSNVISQKKVSARLYQTLISDWGYEYIDQALFDFLNRKLTLIYRNILYVDYTQAKAIIEELEPYKKVLEHSSLVKTYYLYMFMYLTHAQDMILDIDYIEHQCMLLAPFMNQEEKNIHAIVLNGYYYIKGDYVKSFQIAEENIQNVSNPHLKALSYFLMGASLVNEVGQIEKSLRYLHEGQALFETYANYARAQRCQAFILVGLVHSRRYKEFFEGYELFQEVPVLEEDKARVFNFIEGTKARYYMLINQPKKALEILDTVDKGASSNQFFKMVAYALTEAWENLKSLIKDEKKDRIMGNRIHLQLLEILDHYIQKRDEKVMSHALIKLMKEIHDSKDFISNMLITEITVKSCLKNRLFKDAHDVMSKKLALLC